MSQIAIFWAAKGMESLIILIFLAQESTKSCLGEGNLYNKFSNIVLEKHERRVLSLFICSKKAPRPPYSWLSEPTSLLPPTWWISSHTDLLLYKILCKQNNGKRGGERKLYHVWIYKVWQVGKKNVLLYVYFVNANGKYILHWSHPYWSYQSDMSFSYRTFRCRPAVGSKRQNSSLWVKMWSFSLGMPRGKDGRKQMCKR